MSPRYRYEQETDGDTCAVTSQEEETILFLLTSKSKEVFNKIKEVVNVGDFKLATNQSLLSKLYTLYENDDYNQTDFTSICTTEEELNLLTKLMLKQNTSDDFLRITDEVLQTFSLSKMQERKAELLNLMKQTTDEELRNKYQSELREIVSQSAKK